MANKKRKTSSKANWPFPSNFAGFKPGFKGPAVRGKINMIGGPAAWDPTGHGRMAASAFKGGFKPGRKGKAVRGRIGVIGGRKVHKRTKLERAQMRSMAIGDAMRAPGGRTANVRKTMMAIAKDKARRGKKRKGKVRCPPKGCMPIRLLKKRHARLGRLIALRS